jgi:hypothetical protein
MGLSILRPFKHFHTTYVHMTRGVVRKQGIRLEAIHGFDMDNKIVLLEFAFCLNYKILKSRLES